MSVASDEQPVVRIAITRDEFMRLRIRAAMVGTTTPQYLARLVRDELASPLPTQEVSK